MIDDLSKKGLKDVDDKIVKSLDKIVSNYNSNSKITVEKDNLNFWCIIDGKKYHIGLHGFESGYTLFDFISIIK